MAEGQALDKAPGLVCTFYSYKGGVGRSMALANVGVLMATEGHRVLLVDWDLEAPGLEVYFEKAKETELIGSPSETCGVVDLLESHASGTPLSWESCLLQAKFFGSSLDILSSGRRTDDYQRRVQGLDWEKLFSEHRIGNYINSLRDQWREKYDFVLIDSRTGITDIGDICTVILPDILVFFFVTNYQSVVGTKNVMRRAVEARGKMPVNRSKLLAVPMPARDERDREYDKSVEWQRIFAQEFDELYREWLPKGVTSADALNRLFIPYVASWSFGEHIPVVEHERERSDPTSLGAAYARLSTLLSHRLDWSAIEAGASAADVVGARVELNKVREEVVQADLKLEEFRAKTRARRRKFVAAFLVLALLLVSAIALLLWQNSKTLREKEKSRISNQQTVDSLTELGFTWNAEERRLEAATDEARKINSVGPLVTAGEKLDPVPLSVSLSGCDALRSVAGLGRLFLLRNIDLSGCSSLLSIDGLAGIKLVTKLDLSGCTSLANIDGLEGLGYLEMLDLTDCRSLRDVNSIKALPRLIHVNLTGCTSLGSDAVQKLRVEMPKTEIIFPEK